MTAACEEVEDQEDEGWCRELWIQSLGIPAVLPPPEEEKDVKTAIGAARAARGFAVAGIANGGQPQCGVGSRFT